MVGLLTLFRFHPDLPPLTYIKNTNNINNHSRASVALSIEPRVLPIF